MWYSLITLWHERQRFIPGILAVTFSCLLIALQFGLLLGLFSITSIPIDRASADVWVMYPNTQSVDLGQPINRGWVSYLAMPEVERTELYIQQFASWTKPAPVGGTELCLILGMNMGPDSLGPVKQLTTKQREALSLPGTIVIDKGEFERLGIREVNEITEINGSRVRVVGTIEGVRGLAAPYIFCSIETAKRILRPARNYATFILAKCYDPKDAEKVVQTVRSRTNRVSAYTAEGFSFQSRMHWLMKTKAGLALGLAAVLGLLVGMVVTSQTLYGATMASLREYAVLRALGIPRWRLALTILLQSFWVGVMGIAVAVPLILFLASSADHLGVKVLLPWWLWATATGLTMPMALISGIFSLRSLRMVEPVTLLR